MKKFRKTRETVLDIVSQRIKAKIIREKCAYLLNELLEDICIISDEQGLEVPPFTNTRSLKRYSSLSNKRPWTFIVFRENFQIGRSY